MYSFSAYPMPSPEHYGFYLLVAVSLILLLVFFKTFLSDPFSGVIALVGGAVVLAWAYNESYHPYIPENIKVVAVFDRFVVRTEKVRSGKHRRMEDFVYVQLKLEKTGEFILLPGATSAKYPARVQLYWNSKKH